MRKVYLVYCGVVGTPKYDRLDEVFTNKREAEKFNEAQNNFWNETWKLDKTKKRWVYWIMERQVRNKAILKGSIND